MINIDDTKQELTYIVGSIFVGSHDFCMCINLKSNVRIDLHSRIMIKLLSRDEIFINVSYRYTIKFESYSNSD